MPLIRGTSQPQTPEFASKLPLPRAEEGWGEG
jgi:hypothetical protein